MPDVQKPAEPSENVPVQGREFQSVKEFVAATGLSPSTVRRYLAQQKLPKLQFGGKRSRILIPLDATKLLDAMPGEHRTNSAIEVDGPTTPTNVPTERLHLSGCKPKWMR
jgi:hypothetical protein